MMADKFPIVTGPELEKPKRGPKPRTLSEALKNNQDMKVYYYEAIRLLKSGKTPDQCAYAIIDFHIGKDSALFDSKRNMLVNYIKKYYSC